MKATVLRYGFITAGNIIRAMYRGGELHADYNPSKIGIPDINENVRRDYASRGYKTFNNMTELVNNSEMIVPGVTPKVAGLTTDELKVYYRPGQLMLAVVTGVEQPWYTEYLRGDCKVMICMPDMSPQVGGDTFAVSRNINCTDEDVERTTAIFRLCGLVEEIPDRTTTEILPSNGSAPGFFYHIPSSMVREVEGYRLDPDTAIRLFVRTMRGGAEVILSSSISLQEFETVLGLPGGITVTTLEKIESMGFDIMYDEFVRVLTERCREPGR